MMLTPLLKSPGQATERRAKRELPFRMRLCVGNHFGELTTCAIRCIGQAKILEDLEEPLLLRPVGSEESVRAELKTARDDAAGWVPEIRRPTSFSFSASVPERSAFLRGVPYWAIRTRYRRLNIRDQSYEQLRSIDSELFSLVGDIVDCYRRKRNPLGRIGSLETGFEFTRNK
jgi:hypothetical protein